MVFRCGRKLASGAVFCMIPVAESRGSRTTWSYRFDGNGRGESENAVRGWCQRIDVALYRHIASMERWK